MRTKDIGLLGERAAANFLKKQKYKIVAKNEHFSHNELDIVAIHKKSKIIAFVEVKARSVNDDLYSKFGVPSSSVTKSKQARTVSAAKAYLCKNTKFKDFQPRLDVIEVYLKKDSFEILSIRHIENAFGV